MAWGTDPLVGDEQTATPSGWGKDPLVGEEDAKNTKKSNKKKDASFTETALDVGKSIPTGLIKGANAVLGLPADIKNLSDFATKWLISKGLETAGAITPEQSAKLRAGPNYGPTSASPAGLALQDYLPNIPAPTSDNLNKGVFSLTKALGMPEHTPQTTAGEYAKTISEFAPGAVAFGGPGVLSRLPSAITKYGVLPGALSETAGQMTAGTKQEPWARALGALAGSAPGIVNDIVRAPSRQMRHALDGISDETLNKAQALVDESRVSGRAPLTLAEAVQYITNGATRLGTLQKDVEQVPSGADVFRPFYAERPIKSENYARDQLDRVSLTPTAPETVPGRVQGAAGTVVQGTPEAQALRDEVFATGPRTTAEDAGNVIQTELRGVADRREGMRTALADVDYPAARAADYGPNGAPMNPVNVMPVISYTDDLLTSAKGVNARVLRQARGLLFAEGTPDMTVTGLDGARKAIAALGEEQLRKGNKYGAKLLDDLMGQLDSALERVPPYGQARRNFAAASEPLEPFASGKVPGQIVKRDQYGNEFVMPTERVAPAIEKGGPSAADDFLRAAENSPDSRAAFSRYYTQKLLDSATDKAGNISADALAQQVRQNEDMLRRFPEIRVQLDRIGAARNEFGNIERSTVGKLAKAEDFDQQVSVLFGTNPSPGSHVEIGQAVQSLVRQDPDAAKQIVRMYLEREVNAAFTLLHGMPAQSGGWKFTQAIQGNPQQRANLKAVIEALPDGKIRYNAMNKAIRILEAQGARQNVGSTTFGNVEGKAGLQEVSKVTEAASNVISPLNFGHMIDRWRRQMLYEQNGAMFADIFTKGSVDDLRKLAAAPAGGVQGAKVLANILTPRMKEDKNGKPGFALGGSVNADLMTHFQNASQETGVPLPILLAVAKQESNFDPKVTSSTGGRGIMQVQPSTAAKPGFGVEGVNPDSLYDPATNISFGAKYLAAVGRSAGVKDWNDPNEAAKGLLRYNGGGDPNYVQNVGRHLPGYENMRASYQTAQDEPEMVDDPVEETAEYDVPDETQTVTDTTQDRDTIMGLPSYVWAILDPAYKKQLLQTGVNNGTVSEKKAMALLGARQGFAEGGIVEADNPSTAEPQLDTDAQMQAVQDPQAGKDTMFIAKGSEYPQDIPVGTIIVRRPEGDLVTTSLEKAAEFLQTPQLTDQSMAALLGYPEAKSEVTDPVVVQGVEPSGGVSTEMLSSPDKTEEAVKAVLKQSPTAALGILSPDQAQQRRRVAMMEGMV